ncbi:SDR family oxidoreductase [Afifella pfennigii]|uniref:SDR family oxidoreductase n=1 Tax=Afifella pfennigii TaxID=209897 RepID=UPI0004794412|nr:SDR family oxidoreductase [Afifella pfennigii]
MDLGIGGKTALVLGAGGGLGGAIATTLAEEGAKVALADHSEDTAKAHAEAIERVGGTAMALSWELADLAAIDAKARKVEEALGPVDILVNITGGPPPTPAAGNETELWRSEFEAMILSVIAITDRVLPGMRARGWGRIVTSASSGVVSPIPNLGISNALRMTLLGWSKTLAREVAGEGVTANIVVPGRIATKRVRFLDEKKAEREGRTPEEVERASLAAIPAGRYGEPREYADAVAFLASKRAAYITGSILRVDGGLIASI